MSLPAEAKPVRDVACEHVSIGGMRIHPVNRVFHKLEEIGNDAKIHQILYYMKKKKSSNKMSPQVGIEPLA